MARIDLQLNVAVAILAKFDLGKPVELTELEGGSSGSFRVDRAVGDPVVLKTYGDFMPTVPQREVYASKLLTDLPIPATRYLAVDETRTILAKPYAITNYLPGQSVGSFSGEADIADLHRQMGELLRKLHTVRLPAFGHFDENGIIDPAPDNVTYMQGVVAHAFAKFRYYGGDPNLADRLEVIIANNAGIFAAGSGPIFAHDDLNPNNVLAERDGSGRLRLTGLIDFGNARAADAVFDLAKTLFICEHEAPGSSEPILAGYGPVELPEPERALWVYALVHRVVMWWWLRHIGVIADGEEHDLQKDLRLMAARDV
jgi:aminoglycoside phosphotransferase (APT) family kinase protein